MALLRALLYLRLVSITNLVRSRLLRMRQPKYLVGGIAGAAYLWFFFIRGLGPRSNSQSLALAFGDGRAEIFAAIILSVFILLIWVLPSDSPGLSFSEPEVAFLFPAPLSRPQLIHYKLLDGLVTSLLGAMFFALISTGLRHGWLEALRHFGAWWVLNANLSLHQSVAAFAISRLSALGLSVILRRTLLLGGAVLVIGVLIAVAVRSGPDSLSFLLWPARLIVRPFLVDHAGLYALALLPPLGLLALQYYTVHRLASPFEEASIVRAQKTAELVANMRAGKAVHLGGSKQKARPDPFRLGPRLPAEFALLWKNLLVAPAYLNRKVFLGAIVVAAGGLTWLRAQAHLDGPKIAMAVGVVALVLLAYLLLFGPQLARFDLRGDLLHADMLKAWPLPGWRVVLGGLLAPTVMLSAIAWVLVFTAAVGLSPTPGKALWLTPQLRLAAVAAVTLILPALCALQLLVPNGATLLFPAWAQTGRAAPGGMDVMGQRMIFFVGQFICLLLALLPAVLAGALTIFLTQWLIGAPAAILLAALPVLVILLVELWFGVHWVGQRFEALDISAELRP
jgi:ABC-2 type transport system permease protein